MNTIDARGLSCPQPVLLTKLALDKASAPLAVLVDNPTARNNVRRFAENAGYQVHVQETDGEYKLSISKPEK